jgi:spermidine synthase
MKPWTTIEKVATAEGSLELRQRGADDFLITLGGRVLMTSRAHRSEDALARLACGALPPAAAPRLLLGGLGMGYTLRAALDQLPARAQVTVVELNPQVVAWCRGPLAPLTAGALDDPRVSVELDDVSRVIARRAGAAAGSLEAIVLDLYQGPSASSDPPDDPLYGPSALGRARAALSPGGVLAVWGEEPDRRFEQRLASAGFALQKHLEGRGGRTHVVYLGRLPAPSRRR